MESEKCKKIPRFADSSEEINVANFLAWKLKDGARASN